MYEPQLGSAPAPERGVTFFKGMKSSTLILDLSAYQQSCVADYYQHQPGDWWRQSEEKNAEAERLRLCRTDTSPDQSANQSEHNGHRTSTPSVYKTQA